MGEDILRNIQMLNKCKSISFISDSGYHYWQNTISITHNFTSKHFLNLKEIYDFLKDKNFNKNPKLYLHFKSSMFLGALLYINKDPLLLSLFDEIWQQTTFKEKIKIIQLGTGSIKGKLALISACISKPLTIFILRKILK